MQREFQTMPYKVLHIASLCHCTLLAMSVLHALFNYNNKHKYKQGSKQSEPPLLVTYEAAKMI